MGDATKGEPAHLVLADGTVLGGEGFGARGVAVGEAVFTTATTGYQEVLTDPSYHGQIVVMTAPEIGNVGVNTDDAESLDGAPHVRGFVTRSLSPVASSHRSEEPLGSWLERHGVVAIAGVDTRRLTRHLRDHGAQSCAIGCAPVEELLRAAREAPSMEGQNLVPHVTSRETHRFVEGRGFWAPGRRTAPSGARKKVVAYDFGTKKNILRSLVDTGCELVVVPASTSAKEALSHAPDGIFLSNGPGDPAACTEIVANVRELLGKAPLFGICLGHQLLALALGASTYKLKFGHHGVNQPVKDLATGRVEITAQNHGFCVDLATLPPGVVSTHVHLNDGTSEGLAAPGLSAFSVQYHPEAAAGPHDALHLFDRFLAAMS